jgi:galactokinase
LIDLDGLRAVFQQLYGTKPRLFSAPGRVNLIGEHTDYNDGFVLPMAIDRRTVSAAAPRDDRRVRARSIDRNESVDFDLDHPGPSQRGHWIDYIEGVAQALEGRGLRLRGVDLAFASDVPVGAGLSSSAALEVSVARALTVVSGREIDLVSLALIGQQAEHAYVGTRCGIMDQMTAAVARRGHALLIDCRSLETAHIPLDTSRRSIVICDTGVKHELSSSKYNERRGECELGVEILREAMPGISALRDVSAGEFGEHENQLPEPIRRRCRHVITENERTVAAAEALRRDDLSEMGRLMLQSHQSLRDDYEVSCRELDQLVEAAASLKGVAGARMTGGGFGGCTVNLVESESVEDFRTSIANEYNRLNGHYPAIYVSAAGDGVRELDAVDA